MPISSLKHSIDYLKNVYKTGSPKQRSWCLQMLKERWEEMRPDEQKEFKFKDDWKKTLPLQ